jgi:hypothetical protein
MSISQKAIVAIARTNEKHRSPERVLAIVHEAIDLLGGMSSFVKPENTEQYLPLVTHAARLFLKLTYSC